MKSKTTPIPEAIKQLRLCSAFKGYAVRFMDCISTSADSVIYVADNDVTHISEFVAEKEANEKCFKGINDNKKEIFLLSIDHKLIANCTGGVADCALFHSDLFCFLEFKTNSAGHTLKSVTDTYEGAIAQIEHTLDLFADRIKQVHTDLFTTVEVVCHIVVAPKFPRNAAMEQNYSISFAQKRKIELCFDSTHSF